MLKSIRWGGASIVCFQPLACGACQWLWWDSQEALHSVLAVQKPPLKVMEIPSDGDLEITGTVNGRNPAPVDR